MKIGLGNAIKLLRAQKKVGQSELADVLGVDKGNVSRYESGKQAPDFDKLEKLAEFFGITVAKLFEMAESNDNGNVIPVKKPLMLPVLTWVQAGNLTNVETVDMSDVSEWLPAPGEDFEGCFYLKVRGVSNEPQFIEGDYILVDPQVQYQDMQSGDIIVMNHNSDGATFKKLIIEADESKYLQAINPNFVPNIIKIDEECYFVGQVIDSYRRVFTGKRRTRLS